MGASSAGLIPFHTAVAAQTLNNVQIEVQTTNSSLTSYYLTVYNSTGYPVISSSSEYSSFGAMLPTGTYLFVVTATLHYSYYYPLTYATGSSGTAPPVAGGSATGSSVIYPAKYPPVEYGYALKEISGSTALTIQTSSITDVPMSSVTVHVSYANGTAASGAYVSASIVGSYYYYPASDWVMWGQTGPDGSVTLNVPSLPVEVYAYSSVLVNLPKQMTTFVTTVGGENVNVTAYWQPMYVYLEGYALVMPPQTSANITLHVQQPRYYVTPYGTGQTTPTYPSGTNTQEATTTGVITPTQPSGPTNQPQIIPPFGSSGATITTVTTSTPLFSSTTGLALVGITIVAALVAAVLGMMYISRKRLPK